MKRLLIILTCPGVIFALGMVRQLTEQELLRNEF